MRENRFVKPDGMSDDEYYDIINRVISERQFNKTQVLIKRKDKLEEAKEKFLELLNDDA